MLEREIQKAIFSHFKQRGAPRAFAFHPRNGGKDQRGRRAGINAGQGVVSGVPDIIIVNDGRTYALELKRPGGKLSAEQIIVMERMEQCGAIVEIAYGLNEAIKWLEDHHLLLGRAA